MITDDMERVSGNSWIGKDDYRYPFLVQYKRDRGLTVSDPITFSGNDTYVFLESLAATGEFKDDQNIVGINGIKRGEILQENRHGKKYQDHAARQRAYRKRVKGLRDGY